MISLSMLKGFVHLIEVDSLVYVLISSLYVLGWESHFNCLLTGVRREVPQKGNILIEKLG